MKRALEEFKVVTEDEYRTNGNEHEESPSDCRDAGETARPSVSVTMTPSLWFCEVMTTALSVGTKMLGVTVFGTVGFDADFAVEEPHAASPSVATAGTPRHMR